MTPFLRPRLAATLMLALPLGACQTVETGRAPSPSRPSMSTNAPAAATLAGTVTYLPRIALPPDAVVTVALLDVSLADAPSVTVAEQTFPTGGRQVPIPFRLSYDPARIDARHRYAVRAEIRTAEGALAWTTDTVHPVLTNGGAMGNVEIRVVQVLEGPQQGDGAMMVPLAGTSWALARVETASGAVLRPQDGQGYTLAFDAAGRYNGQADCNRFSGEYAAQGEGVTLRPGPVTLAACPPGSFSSDYLRALVGASSIRRTGGTLRVEGASGLTLVLTAR